eukprot:Blabericola_migrator_1__1907@NODE_1519_length_4359_cov_139_504194_g999_i0_p3_GENE_NODE_1519_length_4359_cov_139_504194_g999_i0NODE_1519_length_4359_cov_139_504194_g999_i0_p3_ORF_typecomplete_len302_score32_57_NODE_1519_length_4359_cov_139_504194_g999_i020152920
MLVTPPTRIPSTKCEEEQKLVKMFRMSPSSNTVAHGQCALAVESVSAWSLLSGENADTWTEIFSSFCRILGTFVVTQTQIRTLLNDLYNKNKSPIFLSDDCVQYILIRAAKTPGVQIIEEGDFQTWVKNQHSVIKLVRRGYGQLTRALWPVLYKRSIKSSTESHQYVAINHSLLNKILSSSVQDRCYSRARQQGDSTVRSFDVTGYFLLPLRTLISGVLEPAFPGLLTQPHTIRDAAVSLAVTRLKLRHKATEVKKEVLLVPFSPLPRPSLSESGCVPPATSRLAPTSRSSRPRASNQKTR